MNLKNLVAVGFTLLTLGACPTPRADGPLQLGIVAREMSFGPAEVRASRNRPLRLTLTNRGHTLHDWNLAQLPATDISVEGSSDHHHGQQGQDGPHAQHEHYHAESRKAPQTHSTELHLAAEPGRSASISFIPKASGTYEFFCSVPGHREAGMVGRLIVD